jgi:hypothetical protein
LGQVRVQLKLKSTMPLMQAVQLLMVGPKQKVQLPSQVEQTLDASLG